MNDLPANLFSNPVWNALQTRHRHLALSAGNTCRYPADIAPFAAVAVPNSSALQHLRSLIAPGEQVWLVGGDYKEVPEFSLEATLETLQMVLPEETIPPDPTIEIVRLSAENAAEMVALTNLAFPGFFRQRTHEMGSYYGVRFDGQLIAMAGERLALDDYSEISGVCTHPEHRGKGLAGSLIWHLVRNHRREGRVSWLHVGCENRRAIDLYLRMGFKTVRAVTLNRISRTIAR
jgi:predicted GNAT family acetyltransferase